MKIWSKLVDCSNEPLIGQLVQVREWSENKNIPFVALHDPTTGDYLGFCGSEWARQRIVNLAPVKLPIKFKHISTNTEPVYKHCRKYEIVTA